MVHVTAGARVRVENEGDGRGVIRPGRVARFDAAGAAGKNDVGHGDP